MTNQATSHFSTRAQQTLKHGSLTILIVTDENPESPRNWDNLGVIATWHRRYSLGDEQPRHSHVNDWKREKIAEEYGVDTDNWSEERVRRAFSSHFISLPVYLYDHSGLSVSTEPFSCPWDSGRLGDICVSRKKVRKEFGVKHVTQKVRERVVEVLKSEIATYDNYLTGDVAGYVIQDGDGQQVEAVWGFYPDNDKPFSQRFDYVIEEAKVSADAAAFQHFARDQSGEHDTTWLAAVADGYPAIATAGRVL